MKFHDTPESGLRDFLSSREAFGNVSRGNPIPSNLDEESCVKAGLTAETWKLYVKGDDFVQKYHVKKPAIVPKALEIDISELKELGQKYGSIRYMKAMQCLNIDSPLGVLT